MQPTNVRSYDSGSYIGVEKNGLTCVRAGCVDDAIEFARRTFAIQALKKEAVWALLCGNYMYVFVSAPTGYGKFLFVMLPLVYDDSAIEPLLRCV